MLAEVDFSITFLLEKIKLFSRCRSSHSFRLTVLLYFLCCTPLPAPAVSNSNDDQGSIIHVLPEEKAQAGNVQMDSAVKYGAQTQPACQAFVTSPIDPAEK